MRRLGKILKVVLIGALSLVLLAAAIFGGSVAYLSVRNQRLLAIDSPRGIDEAMYVPIGGIDQWIQIRGQDRNNPVLLWLNGGPGFSTIPATPIFTAWEKDFTVVMWDQRGEGKTFQKSGASVADSMTITRMADDGIEVAQYLKSHLAKNKVILLGHSWGSILGILMAQKSPDLFYAYVGTGQDVNLQRGVAVGYPLVLARARAAGNTRAISALERVGPPPYDEIGNYWVPIAWENSLDASAVAPTFFGVVTVLQNILFQPYHARGAAFSQGLMLKPMLDADLQTMATHFDVPVFFIQGEDDILTPTALAREYFDAIEAPQKEFIVIPKAGHLAIFGARDAFLKILTDKVRPVAVN